MTRAFSERKSDYINNLKKVDNNLVLPPCPKRNPLCRE